MDARTLNLKSIKFGGKWVVEETFTAACYALLCVAGEFKAEESSGLVEDPNELQKRIISDYTQKTLSGYTLGWFGGIARAYKIQLTRVPTGLRTRNIRIGELRPEQVARVCQHEEEVDREEILKIGTLETYEEILISAKDISETSDLTLEERKVLLLSYLRSKYGLYTNSAKFIETAMSKETSIGQQTPKLQHIGVENEGVEEIKHIISKMCSMGETVCLGVPGITKDSVMYDNNIDNQADQTAAREVDSYNYSADGVLVKPMWYRRAAAAAYVCASVIAVIAIFATNATGKDNTLERMLDSFSILTLLLVSIFGLVKLTSEDPSIIRNTLLDRRLIKTAKAIVKHYDKRSSGKRSIYQAILASTKEIRWLHESRACYCRTKPTGKLVMTGNLPVREAWDVGLIVNDSIAMDFRLQRNYISDVTADQEYHKGGDSGFRRIYGFNMFSRENSIGIAGKRCAMKVALDKLQSEGSFDSIDIKLNWRDN